MKKKYQKSKIKNQKSSGLSGQMDYIQLIVSQVKIDHPTLDDSGALAFRAR
jgi:hypothetical protein